MKGLLGLLIAILSGVALWQFAEEWQRGTFGVTFTPPMQAMSQNQVLRTVGPPLSKFSENHGGETWQYTNGRVVRFNYRGEVMESSGFSALSTPAPRRWWRSSPTYAPSPGPNGTQAASDLPPNVSYLQSVGGGGGYAPIAPATPTQIDRQRGWKSSSPLDERAR